MLSTISGCLNNTNNNTPQINGGKIFYVGSTNADYSTIQEAINAVYNNATIIVRNGFYNELIDMNKTITLRGENKNTTIIQFNPDYEISQVPILNINADNCIIENIQITVDQRPDTIHGITVNGKNNTIKNTIITNVTNGIYLTAYSESNTIIYNEITHNSIGIDGTNTLNNNISHNTISNNTQYNIYLSTDSDDNNISFNILENSLYGMRIKGSQYNLVFNNCVRYNHIGLYTCCGARENHFYNNTLINNSKYNGQDSAGLYNIWYNYPNGPGNYWDDYNGTDEKNDGVGDTAYEVPGAGNQDMYPLMAPPLNSPCKL